MKSIVLRHCASKSVLALAGLGLALTGASTGQAGIELRGTATTASGSTSLTITKPTGVTLGDVMIVSITQRNSDAANPTWPSGWNLIQSASIESGKNRVSLAYKVATGSEGYQIGDRQEFGKFELSRAQFGPATRKPTPQGVSGPVDEYQPPQLPSPQDWVLVLERVKQ